MNYIGEESTPMKTFVFVSVMWLAMASGATAQTVIREVNLNALGWGTMLGAEQIDADGNPGTIEYTVWSLLPNCTGMACFAPAGGEWFRVVSVRAEGLCAGAWFKPIEGWYQWKIATAPGGRSMLVVSQPQWNAAPLMREVAFDLPVTCH